MGYSTPIEKKLVLESKIPRPTDDESTYIGLLNRWKTDEKKNGYQIEAQTDQNRRKIASGEILYETKQRKSTWWVCSPLCCTERRKHTAPEREEGARHWSPTPEAPAAPTRGSKGLSWPGR